MNKSELLEIIGNLPDDGDIDVDRLIYTLYGLVRKYVRQYGRLAAWR
jgi:hypothetical protein